jgi:hypothetical protein
MSPYVEIKVVTPSEPIFLANVCGAGYEPLLEGSKAIPFEGSQVGCYCSETEGLHKRECHLPEQERGCETI